MTTQERIERAYRLAFPNLQPPWKPAPTSELAWADATSILHLDQPATSHGGCLSHAILAIALLPEGGGTLGRWTVSPRRSLQFECGATWAHGVRGAGSRRDWVERRAPGSYLDGTAQELLLLMAAADELARREVQPCT